MSAPQYNVNIGVPHDFDAAFKWLKEQPFTGDADWSAVPVLQGRAVKFGLVFSFTHKQDAMLCKLTWGGAQ